MEAATRILKNVDGSVHPCDDFYEFACGGMMNVTAPFYAHTDLSKNINRQIEGQLKGDNITDLIQPVMSARTLYQACMDLDTIKNRGTEPFKEWLSANLGSWPLISPNWTEADFDINTAVIRSLRLNVGIGSLIRMNPIIDIKNNSRYLLYVDEPIITVQRYFLEDRNHSKIKQQEDDHYKFAKSLGFADNSTAANDVKDVMDFEIRLAQIAATGEERRDFISLYKLSTLGELQEQYGDEEINYTRIAIGLLSAPDIGINDVTASEVVLDISPPYLTNLTKVLRTTPKKVIANYISWVVAKNYNKPLKDLVPNNKTADADMRNVHCFRVTNNAMGFALAKKYVEDNFSTETNKTVQEMINRLKASFKDLLSNISWIDETTKKASEDKLNAMESTVGYPPYILNATELTRYYENFTFHSDKYFEATVTLKTQRAKNVLRSLRKTVDKDYGGLMPQIPNAQHIFHYNAMRISAAYLNPPYFSEDYPLYLNYGSMGTILGHEITHGFDNTGSLFNKDGNEIKWWTNSSIANFKEKKKCMIDQYNNYLVDEVNMTVNGINTQGENIADNGAIKQSFNAYKAWVASKGIEEPKLPGLDFTPDQLFFIQFAQSYCEKWEPNRLKLHLETRTHTPGRYRVIGTLHNSNVFSKTFNCPKTSYMNRDADRMCTVW